MQLLRLGGISPLNSVLDESHRELRIASKIGSMGMIMSQLKRNLYLRSLAAKDDDEVSERVI